MKGWFFLHAIGNNVTRNPETARPTSAHFKIDRLNFTEIKIRESKIDDVEN